jgi:hypothetical protein
MTSYTNAPRAEDVKSKMRDSNLEFDRIRILSAVDLINSKCSDGTISDKLMVYMNVIEDKLTNREPLTRGERDIINMLTRIIVS